MAWAKNERNNLLLFEWFKMDSTCEVESISQIAGFLSPSPLGNNSPGE